MKKQRKYKQSVCCCYARDITAERRTSAKPLLLSAAKEATANKTMPYPPPPPAEPTKTSAPIAFVQRLRNRASLPLLRALRRLRGQ